MNRLSPSILSADFSRLGEQITALEQAGAHLIHFDVMDGHYVPNISVGPLVLQSLVKSTTMPFDVHLMIENVDQYIPQFVSENTRILTVSQEACVHLDRSIQLIKSFGIQAGVALNPATPIDVLTHVVDQLDLVLIMSVNPGFGGQKFLPYTVEKIKAMKRIKEERNPGLSIQVDGGITLDNLQLVLSAGADCIVAGNSIFSAEEIGARVKEFLAIMN